MADVTEAADGITHCLKPLQIVGKNAGKRFSNAVTGLLASMIGEQSSKSGGSWPKSKSSGQDSDAGMDIEMGRKASSGRPQTVSAGPKNAFLMPILPASEQSSVDQKNAVAGVLNLSITGISTGEIDEKSSEAIVSKKTMLGRRPSVSASPCSTASPSSTASRSPVPTPPESPCASKSPSRKGAEPLLVPS